MIQHEEECDDPDACGGATYGGGSDDDGGGGEVGGGGEGGGDGAWGSEPGSRTVCCYNEEGCPDGVCITCDGGGIRGSCSARCTPSCS